MLQMPLFLVFLCQPGLAQNAVQEPTSQAVGDPAESGLRIELLTINETRRAYRVPPPNPEMPTNSTAQIMLTIEGPRVPEIFRYGSPVFEIVVDDTGQSMMEGVTYRDEIREATRFPNARQKSGQVPVMVIGNLSASARGAKTIKTGRGTVKVVLATESEEVTIENPLRFRGKIIEHPRLLELGVEISVLPRGDPENIPVNEQYLVVQFKRGFMRIKNLKFYDGWMRETRSRGSVGKTVAGEECFIYQILNGRLTEDAHLVVNVYPKIEVYQLPIVLDGEALP